MIRIEGGDMVGQQMLRAVLGSLRQKYGLMECDVPVDPKFELGGILEKLGNAQPVLFKKVKGHTMPVIGGMFGDRNMFYDLIGTNRKERFGKILGAMTNPMEPTVVSDGPVHENVITSRIDLGKLLPLPTFHELDSSSFITAGVLALRDPDTGKMVTSIRRFQFNGGNNLSALITSPLLSEQVKKCREQKKNLEVAVILGYDHIFCLASQISSSLYGIDKYAFDSALRGEPLELVKCKTVDLEVPAQAELVLEGIIPWNELKTEGPFGELMGYYGSVAEHPVMLVQCVTHRNDCIFQISAPCREEHLSNGLIRDVELYSHVNRLVEVVDANITIGGGCRFHGIVSIKKKGEGDGKTAILGALSSSKDLKHVVIVDDDVDIFDPMDVEHALAARVQASKDVVIIPGGMGTGLDPSHLLNMTTDKVGIDATKPLGPMAPKFAKALIPGYDSIELARYFPGYARKG